MLTFEHLGIIRNRVYISYNTQTDHIEIYLNAKRITKENQSKLFKFNLFLFFSLCMICFEKLIKKKGICGYNVRTN